MAIDPRTLLAHHHPFLCIDTIDEVETGPSARGTKLVTGSVWLAIGYFMGINNARFRGKAVPGEVLSIHVELRQFHRGSCTTHRTALVDGRSVVRADITTIVRPAAAAAPLTVASRDAAAAARRGARLAAARYRAAPSRRILLHALQQGQRSGDADPFLVLTMASIPERPKIGIYALSPSERWELAEALMTRHSRRNEGFAAIRLAFPTAPVEMAHTAAHHLYGDGPDAAVDFLAAAELMIREPSKELDGGATVHLAYHLYNWMQFRALLPEGRQEVLDLVKQLREAVEENDMEFVRSTLESLEDVVEGHRTAPDVTPI